MKISTDKSIDQQEIGRTRSVTPAMKKSPPKEDFEYHFHNSDVAMALSSVFRTLASPQRFRTVSGSVNPKFGTEAVMENETFRIRLRFTAGKGKAILPFEELPKAVKAIRPLLKKAYISQKDFYRQAKAKLSEIETERELAKTRIRPSGEKKAVASKLSDSDRADAKPQGKAKAQTPLAKKPRKTSRRVPKSVQRELAAQRKAAESRRLGRPVESNPWPTKESRRLAQVEADSAAKLGEAVKETAPKDNETAAETTAVLETKKAKSKTSSRRLSKSGLSKRALFSLLEKEGCEIKHGSGGGKLRVTDESGEKTVPVDLGRDDFIAPSRFRQLLRKLGLFRD